MVVRFMVNETRVFVDKTIYSRYLAEKFMRKLKNSKKCTFIACWSL